MKKIIFLFAPLCAMLMVGCVKDEPNATFIKLKAEGFTPDAKSPKAAVEGKYTYWLEGESVWINNYRYTSSVNSDGEAVARDVYESPDHIYRAVYPAEVFQSRSGDNITINVPRDYYYIESGGKQVLENLPMVAYYDGSSTGTDPEELNFKHLTAALTIRVKNEKSDTILEIDRIEVHNSQYQLCGDITVDISRDDGSGAPTITPNNRGKADSVCIHFIGADQGDKTTILPGEYKDFQVPILPIGTENSDFTIKVVAHHEGARYKYNRSTGDRNNSIGRACIGYAVTIFNTDVPAKDLFDKVMKDGKNWFEITCADELVTMSEAMDNKWNSVDDESPYLAGNYIVTEDIDLDGRKFVPIHYYNENGKERCTFDGQDHKIHDFIVSSVNENEDWLCGVFSKTGGDNITIKNLRVEDGKYEFLHKDGEDFPNSTNPCTSVGGIIAMIDHDGIEIENCSVSRITIEAQDDYNGDKQADMYASGIVGYASKPCVIKNCSVGEININNTYETHPSKLVDQFGAAIGRLDAIGNHTYYLRNKAGKDSSVVNPNADVVTIENFSYNQGDVHQLNFVEGLKTVRYGGLIGNITEGGIVVIKNCNVHHNCIIHSLAGGKDEEKYMGGFIGFIRSSHAVGIELHQEGCSISGTIENQTQWNRWINPYIGSAQRPTIHQSLQDHKITSFSLTVTGRTPTFRNINQTLQSDLKK